MTETATARSPTFMLRNLLVRSAGLTAAVASLLAGVVAPVPASAATAVIKPITFPVRGPVSYTDTFGAPRVGHTHEGQDLMGVKMLPLVSTVAGTVKSVKFNNSVGNSVVIVDAAGWTYHYIHVNNDSPGTDDGQATRDEAFPPDIVVGAPVTAGQVVGYMGDSGNAEATAPHLHFEIRNPPASGTYTGVPINPFESLMRATIPTVPPQWNLRRTDTPGGSSEQFSYGTVVGDKALLCDWDADGADEAVIYRKGSWYLRDGTSWGLNAGRINFGTSADTPLCADVDGDGLDEPVLFRSGGTWTIRAGFGPTDPVAWTVVYGVLPGDQPVLGDWDGNGAADLAIHRSGRWYIRTSAAPSGATAVVFPYGRIPGDRPVAGDWDGDGRDDPGIYRDIQWFQRSSADLVGETTSTFVYGAPGTQPLVGHGSGPVQPGIGVFRPKT